jgi:hypothetical protein
MQFFKTAADAIDGYNKALGEAVADAFRTLLEQKHLYQSVVVDDAAIRTAFLPRVEVGIQQHLSQGASIAHGPAHSPWILSGDNVAVATPAGSTAIFFEPKHAKLYCRVCDRIEAYNLESGRSAFEAHKYRPITTKIEAVYVFTYLCQSCKSFPEVFIIRREGGKLTLCGRSPMEYVQVPPEIPKEVARFYSGAVVAHQSGQTLAGLFLLRVLCEQWARKVAAADDYADEAISKYMDSLPEDFKARFPSLRSIYEKLSADIHAATGSDELYVQMLTDINEHFSARKLFRLPTPPRM